MKIMAIIPARGGSQGIKNKNIIEFNGKPLIFWTIKAALNSKYIDKIVVSTDSRKIKDVAEKNGIEVNKLRPKKFSTSKATTLSVLKYELELQKKLNYIPDLVIPLQPTSPLRNTEDIDGAISIFLKNKRADSLVSCVKIPHNFNPESLMIIKNGFLKDTEHSKKIYQRQKKNKYYARNGAAIYISKREILSKNIIGGRILPFEMNHIKSIDIDEKIDLKIAELYLKYLI